MNSKKLMLQYTIISEESQDKKQCFFFPLRISENNILLTEIYKFKSLN